VYTQRDGQVRLWVCRPVHSSVLASNVEAGKLYDDERDLKKTATTSAKWKGGKK
jgi:hypothetical protein